MRDWSNWKEPTLIKLLAVSGSPVKESSTDILLLHLQAAIRRYLPEDQQIEDIFVRLNDLQFIPCQSCGRAPTSGFCLFDDDLTRLYTQLARPAASSG
jgi:multimeric flavodoxin WrbA